MGVVEVLVIGTQGQECTAQEGAGKLKLQREEKEKAYGKKGRGLPMVKRRRTGPRIAIKGKDELERGQGEKGRSRSDPKR